MPIGFFFSPSWLWPPEAPGRFKSFFSYSDCSSFCCEGPVYPERLWPSRRIWATGFLRVGALLPPGGAHPAGQSGRRVVSTFSTNRGTALQAFFHYTLPFSCPHAPSPLAPLRPQMFSPYAQAACGGQVRMPRSSFQLGGGNPWREGWCVPGGRVLPPTEKAILVDLLEPGLC